MFIVLNILILGFVLLIGYWWANQGLFSAIIHMICVVAAGAIALTFWEPLVVNLLLRGNKFDNYVWGISLALLFVISLLILRVTADVLVPGNVKIPAWANLTFGFPVGLFAGVLTMGIFIISAGFLQSFTDPFGYSAAHRNARTGNVEESGQKLWIPVDRITSDFYSLLSVSSLKTPQPLRHVNPEIWKQASLLRDSFGKGKGQFSLKPSEAKIKRAFYCAEREILLVAVEFKSGARDFGVQLTLSNSQVRVIGDARGTSKPMVVHPRAWSQEQGYFEFDDITNYMSSTSGAQSADMVIEFLAPANLNAKYIQIRNTRYRLPKLTLISPSEISDILGGGGAGAQLQVETPVVVFGGSIDSVLTLSSKPGKIRASTNQSLGTLQLVGSKDHKFFQKGKHSFPAKGNRPSRKLSIDGLYEPKGTRIVQLDVSRTSPASIFGPIQQQVDDDAEIFLMDSNKKTYWPIGYIHITKETYTLDLQPTNFIRTTLELPVLPRNNTQSLTLIFIVTENVTITSFRYGDLAVGTCNLTVTPAK